MTIIECSRCRGWDEVAACSGWFVVADGIYVCGGCTTPYDSRRGETVAEAARRELERRYGSANFGLWE